MSKNVEVPIDLYRTLLTRCKDDVALFKALEACLPKPRKRAVYCYIDDIIFSSKYNWDGVSLWRPDTFDANKNTTLPDTQKFVMVTAIVEEIL